MEKENQENFRVKNPPCLFSLSPILQSYSKSLTVAKPLPVKTPPVTSVTPLLSIYNQTNCSYYTMSFRLQRRQEALGCSAWGPTQLTLASPSPLLVSLERMEWNKEWVIGYRFVIILWRNGNWNPCLASNTKWSWRGDGFWMSRDLNVGKKTWQLKKRVLLLLLKNKFSLF